MLIKPEWVFYFYEPATGHQWQLGPYGNKITVGGLAMQARLLTGDVADATTAAMHLALGTGTSPAQANDTKLQTEITRKSITSKSYQGGLARLRTFFGVDEANGDWEESGIFGQSTDVIDTGVLINHLVQSFSKTSNTALTIEVRFIFEEAT